MTITKHYEIALIVPVYNAEKYLRNCLDSIFVQKNVSFIVVCVDDVSTDSSLEILNQYKKNYENLVILNNPENMGPSYSRNQGLKFLKNISSEYFMFIDSDDKLTNPQYLFSFLNKAIKYECNIVSSNFRNLSYKDQLLNAEETVDAFCNNKILGSSCNKLYRYDVFKDCFFNERIKKGEDKEFVAQSLTKQKVLVTSIDGYSYTENENSLMHSYEPSNSEVFERQLSVFKIFTTLEKISLTQCLIYSFCNYFFETFKKIRKLPKKERKELKHLADTIFRKYKLMKFYKPTNKHYLILKNLYRFFPFIYFSNLTK